MRRCATLIIALLVSIPGTACKKGGGTNADFGGDEGKKIGQLVDGLADETGNASRFKRNFTSEALSDPKAAATYARFSFVMKGKPSISGSSATATVVVRNESASSETEQQWSFVKEGDAWKIKSAPLP